MPLLDGLFRKAGGGPVVIPVATRVPVAFRVYYTPGYPPLAPEDLRVKASEWLDEHAEEPLRSALRPVLLSDRLSYTDMPKTSFPPPLDLLHKADVGAEERTRFEAAWQVAVVSCETKPQVPMFGLWAAIAAARSAATELKGPSSTRWRSASPRSRPSSSRCPAAASSRHRHVAVGPAGPAAHPLANRDDKFGTA